MPLSQRFRPGWIPTLGMLFAVALLVSLGSWQVRRLHWKQALLAEWNARIDAPPLALAELVSGGEDFAYRRARLVGRFDHERSILVMHVPRGTREGARVMTPLRLDRPEAGSEAVLVDRGWLPYRRLPEWDRPASADGPVEVAGLVFPLDLGSAKPGSQPPRREWVRFDPGRNGPALQEQLPYRLAPVVVQLGPEASDELLEAGFERPRSRVDHRSYAITWYSMAAVAVVVWAAFGVTRARELGGEPPPARA